MEKGMERNEIGRKGGRQTIEKNTWEEGNINNGCRGWATGAVFIFFLLKILLIFFMCTAVMSALCIYVPHEGSDSRSLKMFCISQN